MTIRWDLPVETTETPPRPVRVLFDKDGAFAGAVYIYDDLHTVHGVRACRPGYDSITLRNVAPPKPEPVLREAFIHLYADGGVAVTYVRSSAAPAVEVRHEKWMSDGSPVPGEDAAWKRVHEEYVTHACATIDELRVERDQWKAKAKEALSLLREANDKCDSLKAEVERLVEDRAHQMDLRNGTIEDLRAEIARIRPVVDATVAWCERAAFHPSVAAHDLRTAVRAYQNTPKKTAEEAVANVAAMMGPVKSCNNCRHDNNGICSLAGPFGFDDNNDCQDWEAK